MKWYEWLILIGIFTAIYTWLDSIKELKEKVKDIESRISELEEKTDPEEFE